MKKLVLSTIIGLVSVLSYSQTIKTDSLHTSNGTKSKALYTLTINGPVLVINRDLLGVSDVYTIIGTRKEVTSTGTLDVYIAKDGTEIYLDEIKEEYYMAFPGGAFYRFY